MTTTITKLSDGQGGEFGRVFFDDGWAAYGFETPDFTNGPYDTAEEAGEALADELEPFRLGGAIDLMLRDCRGRDRNEGNGPPRRRTMTLTEMLNDGRTTRTVIAQIVAARYARRIEAEAHRFVPPEQFDGLKRIAGEALDAMAQGCTADDLIEANRDAPEVVAVIEFARDGGIETAHERAIEEAA